ncbi:MULTISPECIES: murein hydrolase activator EnvC family protein [Campylobacter]|uniref:Zinc metallopeptidase, M23 family n=1 Tax=Campylobacter porcelli TaxID=1660073 RepID=A0A1X9SWA2_9BACT|nr:MULTISPECIES: peptidoglycan DD-metalloendopeptidase family protein [unclassified Campylobacter]ARR00521.1 zinc metallopeptidase, M23 family [Campylobacter sp. RM6137]MCR8678585.1 peptidoglycan DD-metalloendopeptidase family protein [Campylobacter sp. RM19072]MCR8696398.1 peptidoglycan DD-metalloendopeptidase family protein [Campylobacter sp. RM19073]
MRFLLLIALFFNAIFASNVSQKIKDQKDSISSAKKLENQINKKLEELAIDIIAGNKAVENTAKQISELSQQVKALEDSAHSANIELDKLTSQNGELIKSQKDMELRMVKIISEDFAYDLVVPNDYSESQDSIIATEILLNLNSVMSSEFKKLAQDYEETTNLIKSQSKKIESIKFDLREFRQKQASLKSLQNKQKRELEILNQDKNIYSKKLNDIKKQQDEMRKTLENLQILAAKPKEEPKKQAKEQTTAKSDDVRMIGSSYQAGNVKRYNGAKTIAPLDKFSVKQKFGDYIDPVYNIKIFNESVVLRSATTDARVKNVLAGTIVFAKQTPVLDKVVIVENGNGIHTIYAHLDKIAPTIKVGQKVKKGYVIGRVKQDLTFEVTQKNYHINPLELIAMN